MKVYPSDYLAALASSAIDYTTDEEKLLAAIKESEHIADRLVQAHLDEGAVGAPLNLLHLREHIVLVCLNPAAEDRVRLARALQRNITDLVFEHHDFRHAHHGNVVWEFSGPTGYGKSSCMLGLLERANHVQPQDLLDHLTADISRLRDLLPKTRPGGGIAVDEQSLLVGEGAQTETKLMRNTEEQTRYTEVDLYWGSPESRDHTTSQGEFQAFLFNREEQYTKFLVWFQGLPLGYCNLPWASAPLWEAYQPFKADLVARASRSFFHASTQPDEEVRRLFENQVVLDLVRGRPMHAQDWRWIVQRFGSSRSTNQTETIVKTIEFMFDTIRRNRSKFDSVFGFAPTPNMIAACGSENPRGGAPA